MAVVLCEFKAGKSDSGGYFSLDQRNWPRRNHAATAACSPHENAAISPGSCNYTKAKVTQLSALFSVIRTFEDPEHYLPVCVPGDSDPRPSKGNNSGCRSVVELELGLMQSHMTQKPVSRGGARDSDGVVCAAILPGRSSFTEDKTT